MAVAIASGNDCGSITIVSNSVGQSASPHLTYKSYEPGAKSEIVKLPELSGMLSNGYELPPSKLKSSNVLPAVSSNEIVIVPSSPSHISSVLTIFVTGGAGSGSIVTFCSGRGQAVFPHLTYISYVLGARPEIVKVPASASDSNG